MSEQAQNGIWLHDRETLTDLDHVDAQSLIDAGGFTYVAFKTSDGNTAYNGGQPGWMNVKEHIEELGVTAVGWSYLYGEDWAAEAWWTEYAIQTVGGPYFFLDYEDPSLELLPDGWWRTREWAETLQTRYPGTQIVICTYAQPSYHGALHVDDLAPHGFPFAPMAYHTAMEMPGYVAAKMTLEEYARFHVGPERLYMGEGLYDTRTMSYSDREGAAWLQTCWTNGVRHVWVWSWDELVSRHDRVQAWGDAWRTLTSC